LFLWLLSSLLTAWQLWDARAEVGGAVVGSELVDTDTQTRAERMRQVIVGVTQSASVFYLLIAVLAYAAAVMLARGPGPKTG
jgi:hypothetical protein